MLTHQSWGAPPDFKNSAKITKSLKNSYKDVLQEPARNLQDNFQHSLQHILLEHPTKILTKLSYQDSDHHHQGAARVMTLLE